MGVIFGLSTSGAGRMQSVELDLPAIPPDRSGRGRGEVENGARIAQFPGGLEYPTHEVRQGGAIKGVRFRVEDLRDHGIEVLRRDIVHIGAGDGELGRFDCFLYLFKQKIGCRTLDEEDADLLRVGVGLRLVIQEGRRKIPRHDGHAECVGRLRVDLHGRPFAVPYAPHDVGRLRYRSDRGGRGRADGPHHEVDLMKLDELVRCSYRRIDGILLVFDNQLDLVLLAFDRDAAFGIDPFGRQLSDPHARYARRRRRPGKRRRDADLQRFRICSRALRCPDRQDQEKHRKSHRQRQ